MFKLITFLMLTIGTNTCIYSQYIPIPFYLDYKTVEFQKDSLKSIGINKFLLYQINLKTNEECSNDKEVTFFLWDDNNITYVELITDSILYKPLILQNSQIFNYKGLTKTGSTMSEDKLKFKPPYITPLSSDIVICFLDNIEFYFEYGIIESYTEDKSKLPCRKEFINILENEIRPLIPQFRYCKSIIREN